jgi:hypothetical protein
MADEKDALSPEEVAMKGEFAQKSGHTLVVGDPIHLGFSDVGFQLAPKARRPGHDGHVLRGLSGLVKPGELTCILGASGCASILSWVVQFWSPHCIATANVYRELSPIGQMIWLPEAFWSGHRFTNRSGKTSLMNVLSGRMVQMNGHTVKSKVTINGVPILPEELGPKIAYVRNALAMLFPIDPQNICA